jgi:formylglycine-generating enzyme required for sulfatase activity
VALKLFDNNSLDESYVVKDNYFMKNKILIVGILFVLTYTQCYKNTENHEENEQGYSDYVLIKGGKYRVGSPKNEYGRDIKEREQKRYVRVKDFYLAKHEVTQKLYEDIMGGHNSSFLGENYPVDNVTWFEAVEFCNKLSEYEGLQPVYTINYETPYRPKYSPFPYWPYYHVTWNIDANGYRLPTSDEWEIACRAGSRTAFNTGKSITTEQANFGGSLLNKDNHILSIGSFKANAWGFYDMHGNIAEWCWDWYDKFEWLKVFRGGGWSDGVHSLRSAAILCTPATDKGVGFRLAKNATVK